MARNLLLMRLSFVLQALPVFNVNGLGNLAANWFHLVCLFLGMGAGFHIANWDKKVLF
jgi:hypothetical protein